MSVHIDHIIKRETIIKKIRKFFDTKGFHEVIIPVFNTSVPLEPNIYPFKTTWHNTWQGDQSFFLSISPERTMKKMLAAGIGNCYGIGHTFRDLEASGPYHSPEFLMLEWYRENATYEDIMRDTEELIQSLVTGHLSLVKNKTPWPRISLIDLFKQCSPTSLKLRGVHNIPIEELFTEDILFDIAAQKGYSTKDATWSSLFDQIFLNEIEPHLPKTPFFLVDFPARISPLCAIQPDKPYLAQRFEVYINGIELGNGNTENTNVEAIKKVFDGEYTLRKNAGQQPQTVDKKFLTSLEKMKQSGKIYAGIGLGVDRLIQLYTNYTLYRLIV